LLRLCEKAERKVVHDCVPVNQRTSRKVSTEGTADLQSCPN
jgi:hypothetical protein